MIPFLVKAVFFLLFITVVMSVLVSGNKTERRDKFSYDLFRVVSFLIFFSILIFSLRIIYSNDPRMMRVRSESDKFIVELDKRSVKSRILDRNGIVLAEDCLTDDSVLVRTYPMGAYMTHTVGYRFVTGTRYNPGLISTGLERIFSQHITGIKDASSWRGGYKPRGKDLHLTLDARLQRKAFESMGGRKGAVVAMNPKTGEVIVLVSSPSYDPNMIYRDDGSTYKRAEESGAFLNRAISGSYPPGSTFKTVLAIAAIQEGYSGFISRSVAGGFKGEGMHSRIREHQGKVFGEIGLKHAFKVSSNQYFAALGLELGDKLIGKYASELGFMKTIPWNSKQTIWNIRPSQYPFKPDYPLNPDQLASSSIGQYGVSATPLQMCMVASAIGNNGVLMKPRIEADRPNRTWRRVMSNETSRRMRIIMHSVVGENPDDREGTGFNCMIEGLDVGGKTGTAEVPASESHAWFIALAPIAEPTLAISVLVENGGYGGTVAAPIARELFREAMRLGYFD